MTNQIKISFKDYLSEVYEKPAKLHEAYRLFHNYSFLNSILAENQLLKPEPINTYQGWKKLGRQVKKGSKAISLMLPVKYKAKSKNEESEKDEVDKICFTKFIKRPNWFGLSQTEGKEFISEQLPDFEINKALANLGITQQEFSIIDGNCQGYALPNQKIIVVNPMAYASYKTTIHEMAHCLLHSEEEKILDGQALDRSVKEFEAETAAYLVCCSLGKFDHLEYSRGYIRGWIDRSDVEEKNFQRAFDAANQVLKAGAIKG